ncbi:isochorismatase family protein [Singulisphaera sp. PoT]|uniref:isochorismatase family protein n=1 Tax=Singulisphaera sp. PoT TaxID=3411797 RepID=UPI003BF53690
MSQSLRLTASHGGLLVVDIQEKLIRQIHDRDLVIANAIRLTQAAKALELPHWATEQYPKGLGPTIPSLAELVPDRVAKMTFHACAGGILDQLREKRIHHVTLTGIEAHVCIAQTALELLDQGYRVQIPADAVGSRSKFDAEVALRRLERAGAVVSTTEAILFEWTETADRPQFKAISDLIKSFVAPQRVD